MAALIKVLRLIMKNTADRYGLVSRALHWLMALAIIGLLAVGLWMEGLADDDSYKMTAYMLHKATGFSMLLLVVVRVAWLAFSPAPVLPAAVKPLDQRLAKASKHVLYMLMVAIPLSGLLMSNYFGYPVNFYGLFEVPLLVTKNEDFGGAFHELHGLFAYILMGVLTLHIAGVIKHRFSANPEENVLPRMLGK